MKTKVHLYLSKFFLEREMFHTEVVEKNENTFYVPVTFFFCESGVFYWIMW